MLASRLHREEWVRRGEVGNITSSKKRSSVSVSHVRNGVRGFGLPPAKFVSGPFATGAISRNMHGGTDSDSGSDMDLSSDSEGMVNIRQCSPESSPQDDRIPSCMASRLAAPIRSNETYFKHKVHSNLHVSVDATEKNKKQQNSCATAAFAGVADINLSDSATSTEVSDIHCRRTNDFASQRRVCLLDCSSNATSQDNQEGRLHGGKDPLCKDVPNCHIASGIEVEQMACKIPYLKSTLDQQYDCLTRDDIKGMGGGHFNRNMPDRTEQDIADSLKRKFDGQESNSPTPSMPARQPTFHAVGHSPWCAVISYDACVRLCLHSWAKGCMEEAPYFLNNECSILRKEFSLKHVLLQPEEELLARQSFDMVSERATAQPKRASGKMKVQVRKVKMGSIHPSGCTFSSLNPDGTNLETFRRQLNNLSSRLHSGWEAVKKVHVTPQIPRNGSLTQQSIACLQASTKYIKEVSKVLRNGATTSTDTPPYAVVPERYTCLLWLKSSSEEDSVRMQPASGESHVFFPDNHGDDLIIEVQDSKGQYRGRVLAQVAAIAGDQSDKFRWWPIYHEPEHEVIGRIQLHVNYATAFDENNHPKCGAVAETVAYDFILEVAMKVQNFRQRNLLLHGPWKWLVTEFASYYGVSDAYTKLRYLSYVMDVATPTKDTLDLIHELLLPVLMKGNRKTVLSHQENRILGEIEDQLQQMFSLIFENYKSLDESLPLGMMDAFVPATGLAAPVLASAVKLYALLYDVLSPEVQLKFCRYFQVAARKRSKMHVSETDELISSSSTSPSDPMAMSTSYQKLKCLILSIKNEIYTDIQIHNQHVLPSFVDLPNLCAPIYNVDLSTRLRTFLVACPPPGPSPPIADLVIATADFQMDLTSWDICPVKAGVNATELFHFYITAWIQDKRHSLLEMCKLDRVKWAGVQTQHSTTPFVDEMYERLKEALNEYEVIIRRWPDYAVLLGNAVSDVEKAIINALDKQYADVLSPLRESISPKIFGLKYVQKFAQRTGEIYSAPAELGILLNSLKRMLDVQRPKIEVQFKFWACCTADGSNAVIGESLGEIAVMLRSKFRSYQQAIVEKLVENTRIQNATKLKKIIQDSKDMVVESDVQSRMQPLKDLLMKTIVHLHSIVESHLFIAICRGFWDRMGLEILQLLQGRRENSSWYKSSRIAISVLDDTFGSQMQQLIGNALQDKDMEPPRSIMEARTVLCEDTVNCSDSNYYY